jgi:hypothetical protein
LDFTAYKPKKMPDFDLKRYNLKKTPAFPGMGIEKQFHNACAENIISFCN